MTAGGSVAKIAASHACPDVVEPVLLRLPLHHLRVKPSIPAGLSPFRVLAIADRLRNAGGDVDPPIKVRRLGEQDWLIMDGRHRWVASLMAGCYDVVCEEVP